MNLIVDVGNTFVKLAVFSDKDIKFHVSLQQDDLKDVLNRIKADYPGLSKGIVSSVGKLKDHFSIFDQFDFSMLRLGRDLKFPFKNNYTTPNTLGVDRIALVSAASTKFPNKNVLIIDAGTCITYDFLNTDNEYIGGAISPGLRLRYKSLNDFTANLPLLNTKLPKNLIGDSTDNSIHSGVIYGVVNEINGTIEQYKRQCSDLTVILTGGDSEFLSNQLKNGIFATSNFLLEGLNFILEYNSSYD